MATKLNVTVLKDGEVFPAGTEFHGDNKPAFLAELIESGHAVEIADLADNTLVEDTDEKLIEELENDEPVVEDADEETPVLKKRIK